MTTISICGSSSQGNGYIIESGGQTLILELGCRFMDYAEQLKNGGLKNVAGCMLSHR